MRKISLFAVLFWFSALMFLSVAIDFLLEAAFGEFAISIITAAATAYIGIIIQKRKRKRLAAASGKNKPMSKRTCEYSAKQNIAAERPGEALSQKEVVVPPKEVVAPQKEVVVPQFTISIDGFSDKDTVAKKSYRDNHNEYQIRYKKYRKNFTDFIAVDIETTGFHPTEDKIIELAALKFSNGEVVERFSSLINPCCHIPSGATKVNNITDAMVADCKTIEDVFPEFMAFIKDSVLVFHNASFDIRFLDAAAERLEIPFNNDFIDTLPLSRKLFSDMKNHKLSTLAEELCLTTDTLHRGDVDSECTGRLLLKCLDAYKQTG